MRWFNKSKVSYSMRFVRCTKITKKIKNDFLIQKRKLFLAHRKTLSEKYYSYEDDRGILKRIRLKKDKQSRLLRTEVYYGTNILYNKADILQEIKGLNVKPSRKDCNAIPYIGHSNRLHKINQKMNHNDKHFVPKRTYKYTESYSDIFILR